jgi:multisubunit Na+/H+ antiporter MnhB subunit
MSSMRAPRDLHRHATRVLSGAMMLLGVAIIVRTLLAGGGALAVGLILGVLFVLAGAGRLWVAGAGREDRSP